MIALGKLIDLLNAPGQAAVAHCTASAHWVKS
jgi:hypothetical protein